MAAGPFYFAWVGPNEAFDPDVHRRHDETVFRLRISQGEGEFARAELEIRNPRRGLLAADRLTHAFVSCDVDGSPLLLLSGRVVAFPRRMESEVITIELLAQPDDWQSRQNAFVQTLKTLPHYDPLAVPTGRTDDPAEVLAARSGLLHWNRATGEVSLSDTLAGRQTLDLGSDIITAEIDVGDPPVSGVDLEIECQWEQYADSVFSIDEDLREAFGPAAMVNTLTPEALESSWPSVGTTIGDNSGYTVAATTLKRVADPGDEADFPRKSTFEVVNASDPSFDPLVDETATKRKVDMPRVWFESTLDVRAEYRQRRIERIRASVDAGTQPLSLGRGPREEITLRLNDILGSKSADGWSANTQYEAGDIVLFGGRSYRCQFNHTSTSFFADREAKRWLRYYTTGSPLGDRSAASYFQTDRGRQTLEHGLLRARARLAKASRCAVISVRTRLENALSIDCDHSVRVVAPNLPGGEATGKCTGYELYVDGRSGDRYADIRIECAIGDGNAGTVPTNYNWEVGSAGVYYMSYSDQDPYERIRPSRMNALYLLREIAVENSSEQQAAALKTATTTDDAEDLLNEQRTAVDVKFVPLVSEDELIHTITVEMASAWSPPKQIDLGA